MLCVLRHDEYPVSADKTGNRRFWPVDVGVVPRTKTVWRDLDDELDQIWAEAVMRWRLGETLYLTGELEELARARAGRSQRSQQQGGHRP